MTTVFHAPLLARVKRAAKASAALLLVAGLAFPAHAADEPHAITHALGTTTVQPNPERIITLGWSGEDVVIALGEVPVAMPRYTFFDSGMFPWVEEKLDSQKPDLLSGDLDFEAIAALRPDLILGVYSGIDELAYKRLSAIAPTVVYRSAPWSAGWQEQTEVIGEALGKQAEAAQLARETEQTLADLGKQYADLHGATFTFGTYFAGESSLIVYLPSDPRVAALIGMGMVPSEGVAALAKAAPGETSVSVSLEDISTLDADVLVMWYRQGARTAAEAQPLFNTLGAVKNGGYVALEDAIDVWSTSALSVLSIPYGFPRFVPRLAEAAKHSRESRHD